MRSARTSDSRCCPTCRRWRKPGAGNDILVPTYFALLAPAGTPPAIVAKLNAEMKKAIADPAGGGEAPAAGLVPTGSTPEAMAASVKQDVPRFAALVKSIGIKPE